MRIAYIVENYGGRSETFVTDLIHGLAARGHQVRVLVDRSLLAADEEAAGITFIETEFCTRWAMLLRPFARAERLFRWFPVASRLRLSLAHGAIARQLQAHRPDVVYVDFGENAILARCAVVEAGIPWAVHFHGKDASARLSEPQYLKEINRVFRSASTIISPSEHIRRRLILVGCQPSQIRIVCYGIDLSRIEAADWRLRARQPPSVVHLGRLVEKKDPRILVRAFEQVREQIPGAELVIIGGGPLLEPAKELVQRIGLESAVRFLGALPHDQALSELSRHWVYAQHSVTGRNGDQEGFPVSMLEAAACGLPVVSTIHDGIPENVVEGVTGFLVPEYDYEAMAERIVRLLKNPVMAQQMGMAGRARVEQHFQLSRRVHDVVRILDSVVQPTNSPCAALSA